MGYGNHSPGHLASQGHPDFSKQDLMPEQPAVSGYINVTLSPCRHVVLPKELSKLVPSSHLMSEDEWRGLGVQQSQGWMHYMIHKPGSYSD